MIVEVTLSDKYGMIKPHSGKLIDIVIPAGSRVNPKMLGCVHSWGNGINMDEYGLTLRDGRDNHGLLNSSPVYAIPSGND